MKFLQEYAKGIAAGLGAAATALQPIYGAERWYVVIPAVATFFATVAVTNKQPPSNKQQ
jgi:hypothetical protein